MKVMILKKSENFPKNFKLIFRLRCQGKSSEFENFRKIFTFFKGHNFQMSVSVKKFRLTKEKVFQSSLLQAWQREKKLKNEGSKDRVIKLSNLLGKKFDKNGGNLFKRK